MNWCPNDKLAGINFVIVVAFAVLGHWVTYRVPSQLYEKTVYSFIGFAGVLYIIKALT